MRHRTEDSLAIEIPAAIYIQWVRELESQAAVDPIERTYNAPDGSVRMTARAVLKVLLHADGTERITTDGSMIRVVPVGDMVTLRDETDGDEKWSRAVIANAERLSGIKLDGTQAG